ncbi:alpha/beta fold hydrolase [Leucobacter sp. CSA1]|uniref:Alpha/beta fold hydrolase n=1 Tax=Leucobacter chromiisoli TaxID=2796471 RepID=A0A934Q5K0_9MICO|nr:alpha/beta fold hydrolase [Leucobacter chromiisoli]MBK0418058.1 alpha/beta fold hydrolase [Leucobacter chromiisoli]
MSTRSAARSFGLWTGVAAGCAALGAIVVGGLGIAVARRVVTPAARPESRATIHEIDRAGGRIRAWLSGPDGDLPGRYSFIFDDGAGHARLGPVLARRGGSVAREVVGVDRGTLREGVRGRITGWWYVDPSELGYRVERVAFPVEGGEAEAWLVHPRRAKKGRWAVHVHGRGALPEEAIRGVAPFARAGVTSLVISYRNDPGAPRGTHGRYGLGLAESRDVDAAIAEAERRGATRVTLFGWSMGGTACLLSAAHGEHRRLVDGLVLDSPALDWEPLLRHQATLSRVPRPVARAGVEMLGRGVVRAGEPGGLDFERLSAERFARDLRVPVLVHASEGDTFVPPEGAVRFAAARPRFVQLRLQRQGEHVRLWNVDPEGWEDATETFVRALPRQGA